jgi:hypothetical protein
MDDFSLLANGWNSTGFSLVINEFMASNNSIIQDPQGQYDDWVEIYNYGLDAIDASGMYLTDNLAAPTKWQIPGGTVIPAGGYLLIWIDNDTSDSGLHASFKLDADGEDLALFAGDGTTLIDSISFLEQETDISFGRYPDAGPELRFFPEPSPEQQNMPVRNCVFSLNQVPNSKTMKVIWMKWMNCSSVTSVVSMKIPSW